MKFQTKNVSLLCLLMAGGLLGGAMSPAKAHGEWLIPRTKEYRRFIERTAHQEKIDELLAQMHQPGRRIQAWQTLTRFCRGQMLYIGGEPLFYDPHPASKIVDLQQKTVPRIYHEINYPLICDLLNSRDSELRYQALGHCQRFLEAPETRRDLTARLYKIAAHDPSHYVRERAAERLLSPVTNPEFNADVFVAERLQVEKDPFTVLKLVQYQCRSQYGDYDVEFGRRLLLLLSDKDEAVRCAALYQISENSRIAEMYRITLNRQMWELAAKSLGSHSKQERRAAAFALIEMRPIDRERTRSLLLQMANDSYGDVRFAAALGLRADVQREEVRKVLQKLAHDHDPFTAYDAISALGVRDYVPELEKLAHSKNDSIAQYAQKDLEALRRQKQK